MARTACSPNITGVKKMKADKRDGTCGEHAASREMYSFGGETDRFCGLVVRVSGYGYRGPEFDPRRYQIF